MKRKLTLLTVALFALLNSYAQSAKEISDIYKDLMIFESPMATSLKKVLRNQILKKYKILS
ncbi:hypothetical protein [Niabella ginsengisoli]|uniref:Uncharacterized protein n=1 Tax=Niabella ginsengisoli TaxID=522298 RepID=A0ABS9SJR0_9BACT|nr:hypothetical protein [Niabella ginsengisoli]MCH5598593.1 hypothetical protein [Niabella ginsengisoli]